MKTFIVKLDNKTLEIQQDLDGKFIIPNELRGLGTALKPASEHWILVRKPLGEKTVAANVLKHGTGGLNIDGCRIALDATDPNMRPNAANHKHNYSEATSYGMHTSIEAEIKNCDLGRHNSQGRFPANVVLDEEAAELLDEQSGELGSSARKNRKSGFQDSYVGGKIIKPVSHNGFADTGGASRFFYVAKASKKDRGENNTHPTVKSTALMEYLIKLVTPPNGLVLDPFMGSGSTGVACVRHGFSFTGIEYDDGYLAIATKRIGDEQEDELSKVER